MDISLSGCCRAGCAISSLTSIVIVDRRSAREERKFGSVQESVRDPDFSGVGRFAVSSPPSSSLWKCGNPRLVRVSKLGGTGNNLRPRFRHRSLRASFLHSELGILPSLLRLLSLAEPKDPNARFQKSAQNEHFYRLSCGAGNSLSHPEPTLGMFSTKSGGRFLLTFHSL
jgi:hypothetical protein